MKRTLLAALLVALLLAGCNGNSNHTRRIDGWQRVETEGWLTQ